MFTTKQECHICVNDVTEQREKTRCKIDEHFRYRDRRPSIHVIRIILVAAGLWLTSVA